MGPGTKLPSLGHTTFDIIRRNYAEQAAGLIEGGADILLIETCQDILQTKAATVGTFDALAQAKKDLPVMVQVTVETTGTLLLGTEMAAAITALEPYPIASLGMNCATGPQEMSEHVRTLSQQWARPISVLPNAGLPENVGGHAVYKLTPQQLADHLKDFVTRFGVNIVGGCCGTTPAHLKAVVEAVKDISPLRREPQRTAASSSIFIQQPYRQETSFLIVGERVNASGSKKMRDLLNAEDWDGLVSLAREQEREGAHVLDVNVDFVGRDGVKDMHELASRLATNIKIPLMFDSTEWHKMEAGLEHDCGKCILNLTY